MDRCLIDRCLMDRYLIDRCLIDRSLMDRSLMDRCAVSRLDEQLSNVHVVKCQPDQKKDQELYTVSKE